MFKSILIESFGESEFLDDYLDLVSNPDIEGEKHHILPKSIFPAYAKCGWNLVILSVERHFNAHSLLPDIVIDPKHKHKMICAKHMMLKHRPEGFDYIAHKELMREVNTGENNPMFGIRGEKNPNFGKPLTDSRKKNISESLMGEKHPMYGVKKSEAFRKNLSDKRTGMKFTEVHKKNISDSKSGENHPMWGKHKSEETKQRIGAKVSGENNGGFGKTFDSNPNSSAVLFEGTIYTSSLLASIELGVNPCTMTRRIKRGAAIKLPKDWATMLGYTEYKIISEPSKKEPK